MVGEWPFFMFMEAGDSFVSYRWSWRVVEPDGNIRRAERGFGTLRACQADAAAHGYLLGDLVSVDSEGMTTALITSAMSTRL